MRDSELTRDGAGVSGEAGADDTWGVPPSVVPFPEEKRQQSQRLIYLDQRAFWIRWSSSR